MCVLIKSDLPILGSGLKQVVDRNKKEKLMKPNQNFRMSKATKRVLSLTKWKSAEHKNAFKRVMINAELTAAYVPKVEKKD